jgi:hypothetical protein
LTVADLDDDGVDEHHRVDAVERAVHQSVISSSTVSVIREMVSVLTLAP